MPPPAALPAARRSVPPAARSTVDAVPCCEAADATPAGAGEVVAGGGGVNCTIDQLVVGGVARWVGVAAAVEAWEAATTMAGGGDA